MATRSGLRCVFVITVLVFAVLAVPGVASAFPDTEGHWAAADIDQLAARGIMSGLPDGRVYPERPITRAELVHLLTVASGLTDDMASLFQVQTGFTDVTPGYWANGSIEIAWEMGWVSGRGQNRFVPEVLVRRDEMAAVLARMAELPPPTGDEGSRLTAARLPFGDRGLFKRWAVPFIAAAYQEELMSGAADGSFTRTGRFPGRRQPPLLNGSWTTSAAVLTWPGCFRGLNPRASKLKWSWGRKRSRLPLLLGHRFTLGGERLPGRGLPREAKLNLT